MAREYVLVVNEGRIYHEPRIKPNLAFGGGSRLATKCGFDSGVWQLTAIDRTGLTGRYRPCRRCYRRAN